MRIADHAKIMRNADQANSKTWVLHEGRGPKYVHWFPFEASDFGHKASSESFFPRVVTIPSN